MSEKTGLLYYRTDEIIRNIDPPLGVIIDHDRSSNICQWHNQWPTHNCLSSSPLLSPPTLIPDVLVHFYPLIMRATTSNPLINNDIYNIALHTTGLTVGPMPVPEFLDKFLPSVERLGSRTRRSISSRLPANRVNETFVSYLRLVSDVLLIISSRWRL